MTKIRCIGPYFLQKLYFEPKLDFLFILLRHQVQDSESEEDFQPYFDEVRASF